MQAKLLHSLAFAFSIILMFFYQAAYGQNQQKIDSLEKRLAVMPEDTEKVMTLIALGTEYGSSDPARAIDVSGKAIELSKHLNFTKGTAAALALKGSVFINASASDSAIKTFNELLEMGIRLKDSLAIADGYNGLAKNEMVQGNQNGSIENYKRAIGIYQRFGQPAKQASASVYLSMAYSDLGQFENALKYATDAEALFKKTNDKYGLGKVYLTIGDIYNGQLRYADALPHYKRGLAMMTEVDNKSAIANASVRVGGMQAELGEFDSALYHFENALQISRDLKMPGLESDALMGKAEIYYGQKKYDLALQNSIKALEINKAINNIYGYLNCYNLLGLIYSDQKNYDKAAEYSKDFLDIANQMGAVEQSRLALDRLTKIEKARGNYEKAFNYLQTLTTLNDSLHNSEKEKAIQELETKYETDKKDQQISLLNTQQQLKDAQLARQRLALGGSITAAILLLLIAIVIVRNIQHRKKVDTQIALLEKQNEIEGIRNKISLDIHDDIGAGLTKINLLLNQFKSKAVENGTGDETLELVNKISTKSREVISGLGEIVWTANPSYDNLKSLLGFMRQYITRFFEDTNIRYQVDFPEESSEMKIHPELKRNLFLVLKESLNNVLKHSGATEVIIRFRQEGEKFSMEITDNGVGINEKVKSVFGNGLKGMRSRIEEVKGKFDLTSSAESGTNISLEGILY